MNRVDRADAAAARELMLDDVDPGAPAPGRPKRAATRRVTKPLTKHVRTAAQNAQKSLVGNMNAKDRATVAGILIVLAATSGPVLMATTWESDRVQGPLGWIDDRWQDALHTRPSYESEDGARAAAKTVAKLRTDEDAPTMLPAVDGRDKQCATARAFVAEHIKAKEPVNPIDLAEATHWIARCP